MKVEAAITLFSLWTMEYIAFNKFIGYFYWILLLDTFIGYFYWILLLDTFIGYFYSGKMNLGALDATQHQSVAQEYGVQGYPTIKYFAPGSSGNIRAYIPITQPSSTLHPVAQVILEYRTGIPNYQVLSSR